MQRFRDAFADANQQHQDATKKVFTFLNDEVRDLLERNFQIGWGPRLDRQLQRFVPVVIAAGGTVAEAVDHILAMRLLRKLKNRHDNQGTHLVDLRNRILEKWPSLEAGQKPQSQIYSYSLKYNGLSELQRAIGIICEHF